MDADAVAFAHAGVDAYAGHRRLPVEQNLSRLGNEPFGGILGVDPRFDRVSPLGERVLCVSGRLSVELVQKAAVAGAPILVGVGAPTSLAVALADESGMTLCGFARRGGVNVYTGEARVGR